jgi:acyl-CoA thioesterase-2
MGDLALDTAVEGSDGRFRAHLSPDWEIWGPNGGYLAVIALRAAGAHVPLRRPASIACHYLGVAAFDDVELEVRTVRATKRAASVAVSMHQDGRQLVEALVWIVGDGLDGLEHTASPLPEVPGWEETSSVEERVTPARRSDMPFWRNLEERPIDWIDDWDAREPGDPRYRSWFRYRPQPTFDDPFVDAGRALVLLDTMMWPAAVRAHPPGESGFYAPSIDVQARFHARDAASEWLLCDARSPWAADGLVGGTAQIWSANGTLLATGGQQMLSRPATLLG